jgi:hypothetical protein
MFKIKAHTKKISFDLEITSGCSLLVPEHNNVLLTFSLTPRPMEIPPLISLEKRNFHPKEKNCLKSMNLFDCDNFI